MSDDKLTLYKSKGLTEDEAKQLAKYNESGRQGVSRLNVDALRTLYNVGYSCQEIHNNFPEYPLGAILLARVQQNWDEKREEHRKQLEMEILKTVKNARMESVKLVADLINATQVSWKQQLMTYLANPEKEKIPEFLPKTLHQFTALANSLKDLTETDKNVKNDTPGANGGGLPTIIINNNGSPSNGGTTVEVSHHAQKVKEALVKSAIKKPE
jgi:hypothetical protein